MLNNGQVLFVGGDNISSTATQPSLNMSELYDPASGVFIVNAPTNAFRFFLTVTLLSNNGQVLVTGQETSAIIVTPPVPSELYQP